MSETKILSVDEKLRKLVHGSRDTVGVKLYNHLNKQIEQPDNVDIEETRSIRAENYLELATQVANEDEHRYDGDYFVVTATRYEPLLEKNYRFQTYTRKTCPTPTFGQTVWRVRRNDTLELVWSVYPKKLALPLIKERTKVPPSQYPALQQILWMIDGTLDLKCNELNGEHAGSPYLAKKPIYTSTGDVWKQK